MAVYQPGIPTGQVELDQDYVNIQGNFTQLNVVYGTDHYPFDNATPNQGFHNLVTTPSVVNNPPDGLPPATAAGILKLYAYQQYAAFGPLQYSRGPSSAIPTPLTSLHGGPINIPANTKANIIDLVGMTRVMLRLSYFSDIAVSGNGKLARDTYVAFSQGTSNLNASTPVSTFGTVMTGTVLQIHNNMVNPVNNVYWTLEFIRIE